MSTFLLPLLLVPLGSDIHVPGDQPTIQAAVGVAVPGDVVIVAPGTYFENVDYLGKDITIRSSAGPDVTTLIATTGFADSAVKLQGGETAAAILDGFTVQESASLGSAPTVLVKGASPTLRNLRVRSNLGASIWIEDGSPRVLSCEVSLGDGILILRSDAEIAGCSIHDTGTGIRIGDEASPEIHHSVIRDNATGIDIGVGPILPLAPGVPVIHHCVLARNFYDIPNGSGVVVGSGYSAEVTDSLFWDHPNCALLTLSNSWVGDHIVFERNRVFTNSLNIGSAVQCYEMDDVTVRGNLFAADPSTPKNYYANAIEVASYQQVWAEGNTVVGFGVASEIIPALGPFAVHAGGIYHDLGVWNDYWGVLPTYSAVPNTGLAGTGCIQVTDPLFVDRGERDYHLRGTSPCIDVGPLTGSTTDVDGDTRVAPFEMGGDEVPARSHWMTGAPLAGSTVRLVAQGTPGQIVVVGWASDVLSSPIVTPWGDFWLDPATLGTQFVGTIGADGLLAVPGIPVGSFAVPASLHTQVLVGPLLTSPRETTWGG